MEHEDVGAEDPQVLEQFQQAANIADEVVKFLIPLCVPGAKTLELAEQGDVKVVELSSKAEAARKPSGSPAGRLGIAFPTSIAVNEIVGNYSPTRAEAEKQVVLKEGDVVKIALGVHIGGYPATSGHCMVVAPATGSAPVVSDKRADVIMAAHQAAEAALQLLKPGVTNTQVGDTINRVMQAYGCSPLQNSRSHEHRQDVVDSYNMICPRQGEQCEKITLEAHQVYGMDIHASTGDGKTRPLEDMKCTVYKKDVLGPYTGKSPLSRTFFQTVSNKAGVFPFHVRVIENDRAVMMGVSEGQRYQTLSPYDVVSERPGEYTAGLQFTVLILPEGGNKVLCGMLPIQSETIQSAKQLSEAALQAIVTPVPKPVAKP